MNRRAAFFILISALSALPQAAYCEAQAKIFNTKYTAIHYIQDKDLGDFIWRLGGQRLEFPNDNALASSRVDRIMERVKNILDMRPSHLKINIYLKRGGLSPNKVAYYDPKTKSMYISVDYVTDGVFAHEAAHAIIDHNFGALLPSKIQEILTQYVDKYLWNDYF